MSLYFIDMQRWSGSATRSVWAQPSHRCPQFLGCSLHGQSCEHQASHDQSHNIIFVYMTLYMSLSA